MAACNNNLVVNIGAGDGPFNITGGAGSPGLPRNGVNVGPTTPPAPAQEFDCWPWLLVIPPLSIPGAGVECPASFNAALPAAGSFRLPFLGHSTDVTLKNSAGAPLTGPFNPPLKICFRYKQPELDAVGGSPAQFHIQTFRNGVWESLPTTPEGDPSSQVLGRVCAPVDHLTLFAIFVKDGAADQTVAGESSQAAISDVKYLPETGLRPVNPWLWAGGLALAVAVSGLLFIKRRK